MRKYFLAILVFLTLSSYSQKNREDIQIKDIVLGKNIRTSSEIKAKEYVFPGKKIVYKTYFDTVSGLLSVQLRKISRNKKWYKNKGLLLVYDSEKNKIKWEANINYQRNRIYQNNNIIIYTANGTNYVSDVNNGKEIFNTRDIILHINSEKEIGIVYKTGGLSNTPKDLQGINLKNGELLWERKISSPYGWNDYFYLNDSTLVIAASGIHTVNIFNGKGWDYNTDTGAKDHKEAAAAVAGGVALGLLTGMYAVPVGNFIIRDIASNMLLDSSYIFFASKEQLVKIDKNTGKTVWIYPFEKKTASKSDIFINNGFLYMINYGYARENFRKINYGKPFIAAFDIKTGKQKFLKFPAVKKDIIYGYSFFDGNLFLFFKNRIEKYSSETGKYLQNALISEETFGNIKDFISDKIYVYGEQGNFVNLNESDTTKVFFSTDKKEILSFDKSLNISKENKKLFFCYYNDGNMRFILDDTLTYVINDKGEKTAELNTGQNTFVKGNYLFCIKNGSVQVVKLSEILKE